MKRPWRRLCRAVGSLAIALFALAALTPVSRWLYETTLVAPGQGNADAVVVLGAAVSEDGLLDSPSLRRALAGILALREGRARTLVLLGAPRGSTVEAEVRAQLARSLGVAPEVIVTEPRGLTTRQEAQRTAELLLPRDRRRILLVTGESHMWRASAMFRRVGFDVVPLPVREQPLAAASPRDRLRLMWQVLREGAARTMHRALGRV